VSIEHNPVSKVLRAAILVAALASGVAAAADAASGASRTSIPRVYFGLHILAPDQLTEWPPIGFGAWRLWDTIGTTWADINPQPDTWNFGPLDKAVQRAEAARVELVMTLGQTPTWASSRPDEPSPRGAGSAAPPSDLEAWARYVARVASRYKGRIAAYEIWNEPRLAPLDRWNKAQFFFGSASDLAALSRIAYETVKRVDPGALVLSPAFDGEDLGERRLAAFLAAGGGCCFDVLSVHLYPHTSVAPEGLVQRTARLRALMQRAGLERPIWNTEFGYLLQESGQNVRPQQPSGFLSVVLPPATAKAYLARSLILGASAGLERFYWYAWDTQIMSLLTARPNRRPSAAAYAYGEVARWLVGGRVSDCEARDGAWACRYQGPISCSGRIYWVTEGSRQIPVPETFTRVRRIDGTDVSLPTPAALELGIEPLLVHAGAPPAGGCAAR